MVEVALVRVACRARPLACLGCEGLCELLRRQAEHLPPEDSLCGTALGFDLKRLEVGWAYR